MCLLTYWPLPSGKFIFTHNRDEAPGRSAPGLSLRTVENDTLVCPLDAHAGGTWIAAAKSGRAAAVLNGAFLRHERTPPYRRSRGLVMLDFFADPDPETFFRNYNFDAIEPFTLVSLSIYKGFLEFRWDGHQRHLAELDPLKPHIWSSATLYPPEIEKKRRAVFLNWANNAEQPKIAGALRHLHFSGSVGDPENDFVMDRGGRVRTVSMTQLIFEKTYFQVFFSDFEHKQNFNRQLQVEKKIR